MSNDMANQQHKVNLSEVYERIHAVEGDVGKLAANMAAISKGNENIESRLDIMTTKLEGIATKQADSGSTKWGVVYAGCTLGVLIGTLALTPIYTSLTRQDDELRRHSDSKGHTGMIEKSAEIESRLWSHITMDGQRHESNLRQIEGNTSDIKHLQKEVVPRSEHLEKEKIQREIMAASKAERDETRRRVAAIESRLSFGDGVRHEKENRGE